mgnify:CR=1 FL=1
MKIKSILFSSLTLAGLFLTPAVTVSADSFTPVVAPEDSGVMTVRNGLDFYSAKSINNQTTPTQPNQPSRQKIEVNPEAVRELNRLIAETDTGNNGTETDGEEDNYFYNSYQPEVYYGYYDDYGYYHYYQDNYGNLMYYYNGYYYYY